MKMLLTLALLALICFHSASALPPIVGIRQGCCPQSSKIAFKKEQLKDVRMTPQHCPEEAVVVTLKNGNSFCLDPTWRWAQKQLAQFQKAANENHTWIQNKDH